MLNHTRTILTLTGLLFTAGCSSTGPTASSIDEKMLEYGGSSHALIEVDTDSILKAFMDKRIDIIQMQLHEAQIHHTSLQTTSSDGAVSIQNPDQFQAALDILKSQIPSVGTKGENSSTITFNLSAEEEDGIRETSIAATMHRLQNWHGYGFGDGDKLLVERNGKSNLLTLQFPVGNKPEGAERLLNIPMNTRLTFHILNPIKQLRLNKAEAALAYLYLGLMSKGFKKDSRQPKKRVPVLKSPLFSSNEIQSAEIVMRPDGLPTVHLKLNTQDVQIFQNSVGKTLAVVENDKIIMRVLIEGPEKAQTIILGGNLSIQQSRRLMDYLLKAYSPAPIKIIQEWVSSPPYDQSG